MKGKIILRKMANYPLGFDILKIERKKSEGALEMARRFYFEDTFDENRREQKLIQTEPSSRGEDQFDGAAAGDSEGSEF